MEKIFAVKKKQKMRKSMIQEEEINQRESLGARMHSRLKFKNNSNYSLKKVNYQEDINYRNQSFTDYNDYGEEEERYYFSDSEARKKDINIYETFPNKYDLILHYNIDALKINKKLTSLSKHPPLKPLKILTKTELMDRQIKKWKGLKIIDEDEEKDKKNNANNLQRTKMFMVKLIQNLEIWKFEKIDDNRYDKIMIADTKIKKNREVFRKNKEKVGNIYFELERKVYKFYPSLMSLNIPKVINENVNLNRFKMYEIFIQYKILMKVCIALNKAIKLINYRIDFETFFKGVPQMRSESEELARKIFETINERHNNYLSWDEFLKGMISVKSKSIADKIDMFFKVLLINYLIILYN